MIQVCSACATRWNVRDRKRVWCPRCQGTLLEPTAEAPDPRLSGQVRLQPDGSAPRAAQRLPGGYRWIAVRPGAAPPARHRRRPPGPTPRYAAIPRWSLLDRADSAAGMQVASKPRGLPAAAVRTVLFGAMAVLGGAALVHLARYVLLIVNRHTLLNPVLAGTAFWLGALTSLAAIAAVIAGAVTLTRWLIARRAAAFAYRGQPEPRPGWSLWAGCLVPVVNLIWAPVFAIELAVAEESYRRLRKPITVWWILWILSTTVSVFAIAGSRTEAAQGIADNTLTVTFAYLLAVAVVAAAMRVFEGFERKPVERPVHRWVVVPDDGQPAPASAVAVEPEGQDPAA